MVILRLIELIWDCVALSKRLQEFKFPSWILQWKFLTRQSLNFSDFWVLFSLHSKIWLVKTVLPLICYGSFPQLSHNNICTQNGKPGCLILHTCCYLGQWQKASGSIFNTVLLITQLHTFGVKAFYSKRLIPLMSNWEPRRGEILFATFHQAGKITQFCTFTSRSILNYVPFPSLSLCSSSSSSSHRLISERQGSRLNSSRSRGGTSEQNKTCTPQKYRGSVWAHSRIYK